MVSLEFPAKPYVRYYVSYKVWGCMKLFSYGVEVGHLFANRIHRQIGLLSRPHRSCLSVVF